MYKWLVVVFGIFKFSKIFFAAGTMLLSLVIYAWLFGWPYAVGFMGMLLVHEMGHFIAAKQHRLNVGLPTFIPFVGAWVELKEQPMSVETEAYIAFAGPLLGSLAAFFCYFLAQNEHSSLLLAVAYTGFFLNWINLIPISPFDGGRIVAIVSPRIWLVGLPILIVFAFYRPSPIMILMVLITLPQAWAALKFNRHDPAHGSYYVVNQTKRIQYGCSYLLVLLVLSVMTFETHEALYSVQQEMDWGTSPSSSARLM